MLWSYQATFATLATLIISGVAGVCPTSESSDVCIFSFNERQPDATLKTSDSTGWLQSDLSVPPLTDQLSICFHFYLVSVNNFYGTLLLTVENSWMVMLEATNLWLFESTSTRNTSMPYNANLRQWTHVCVMIGNKIGLFVDDVGYFSSDNGTFVTFDQAKLKFCFGVNRLYLPTPGITSPSFKFTHPRIYFRELTSLEVQAIVSCSTVNLPSDQFSFTHWKIYSNFGRDLYDLKIPFDDSLLVVHTETNCLNFSSHPNISSMCSINGFTSSQLFGIQMETISKICAVKPTSFLYFDYGSFSFLQSEALCKGFRGNMISLEDDGMVAQLLALNQMNVYAFLRQVSNDSDMCQMVSIIDAITLTPSTIHCSSMPTPHILCNIPTNASLDLRLVMDNNPNGELPRVQFFLSKEEKVMYSYQGAAIFKNDTNMFLTNADGTKYQINLFSIPIGRHQWTSLDPSLQDASYVLSGCIEGEFTCDSGKCIPLEAHCDGIIDCGNDDISDEVCDILITKLEANSSQVMVPPAKKTALKFKVERVRVTDVVEAECLLKVDIKLTTEWKDRRLRFSQLTNNSGDNILPQDGYWTPTFRFPNALFEDQLTYQKGDLSVREAVVVKERTVDPIVNDYGVEECSYNGDTDSSVILMEEFTGSFYCEFELTLFPFDVHECRINITLLNKGSVITYFNKNDIHVISEVEMLTMFIVYPMSIDDRDLSRESPTNVSIKMILARRFDSYFLTTILPCLLITFLSNMTHLFEVSNFTDRIMVNLSCLIVLASLFAQVTTTLPQSPEPKALEVFFFYCIAKCSLTFVCLRTLDKLNRDKETQQKGDNSSEYRPELFTKFPARKVEPFESLQQLRNTANIFIGKRSIEKEFLSMSEINYLCLCFVFALDFVFLATFTGYIYFTRKHS